VRFDGRTAVITGGAIGFGRAFARALVAEGANGETLKVSGGYPLNF
jgi:NAD(P)-dependent dehydrogenase (short-subunit alcohol dehydrogenase family)